MNEFVQQAEALSDGDDALGVGQVGDAHAIEARRRQRCDVVDRIVQQARVCTRHAQYPRAVGLRLLLLAAEQLLRYRNGWRNDLRRHERTHFHWMIMFVFVWII